MNFKVSIDGVELTDELKERLMSDLTREVRFLFWGDLDIKVTVTKLPNN